jgi:hypothetical protein
MGKPRGGMESLGKGDIEGKAAMVAASKLESERVSNERERMSQCFRSLDLTPPFFLCPLSLFERVRGKLVSENLTHIKSLFERLRTG